jgi:stage V sporulation protein S
MNDNILRVSAGTPVEQLAGSILKALTDANRGLEQLTLRAVGAGAVNQAIKAVAVASERYSTRNFARLGITPSFTDIEINGNKVSALCLTICITV